MRCITSCAAKPLPIGGNAITAEYLSNLRLCLPNAKGGLHGNCINVPLASTTGRYRSNTTSVIQFRLDGTLLDDPAAQFLAKTLRSSPIAKRIGVLRVVDSGSSPFPPVIAHNNMLLGWAMGCDALCGDDDCYVHLLHDVLCNKKVRASVPLNTISANNCKVLFGCDYISL